MYYQTDGIITHLSNNSGQILQKEIPEKFLALYPEDPPCWVHISELHDGTLGLYVCIEVAVDEDGEDTDIFTPDVIWHDIMLPVATRLKSLGVDHLFLIKGFETDEGKQNHEVGAFLPFDEIPSKKEALSFCELLTNLIELAMDDVTDYADGVPSMV